MKFSLVIPCFNEEQNVAQFFAVSEQTFKDTEFVPQYVFVNDGSRDNTLSELKKLYENEAADFRIVSFSRNFGKEAAILAGLSNADGELTCVIDADLQQRPEIALQMARELLKDEDLDCVAAYQAERNEGAALGWFKSMFYKVINFLTDVPFTNGASDFRVFRAPVREAILSMKEYHRFSKGIFAWVGFNVKFMPYVACERASGESKWNFFKLFKYAVDGIVAFTTKPLQLPTVLGTLSCVGACIYYLFALIVRILYGYWNSIGLISAAIFLTGGLVLLCMGVMGMYLSRIYLQVKERPVYIAKEILSKEKDK